MKSLIIVPSLKISGGIRESIRIASELQESGIDVNLLSLWVSPNQMPSSIKVVYLSSWSTRVFNAIFQLPILVIRFLKHLQHLKQTNCFFIFTHYSTLPFSLLVPRRSRFYLIQGFEWNFVSNKVISWFLRLVLIRFYKSGSIISASAYITEHLISIGLKVNCEAPVWADPAFYQVNSTIQDIDFSMVLAKAKLKRLDLYIEFIILAREYGLRVAIITPEDEIALQLNSLVNDIYLRPTVEIMREIYSRSYCFIHLSEFEGFGLPPLEAMGAGCIPICRDSGGVQSFMMDSPFENLLLPPSMSVNDIFNIAIGLLHKTNHNEMRLKARSHFQFGLFNNQRQRKLLITSFSKLNF